MACSVPSVRTSGKATASLILGFLSFGSGVLAVVLDFYPLVLGVVVFFLLAVVFGLLGWRDIKRSGGQLGVPSWAGWGIGTSVAGILLGFLVFPAT
jgi:hypothetical protein